MTKQEIRKEYKNRRKSLSEEQIRDFSQQIATNLVSSELIRNVEKLHMFLPIRKHREIDTHIVIHRIKEVYPHVHFVISRSNADTRSMQHCLFTDDTELIETAWGIPEPSFESSHPIDSREIDAVLVPLLAFDERGYRVGYGMGFYDRFLAECRPEIPKIGLSYEEPLPVIEEVDAFDIRMTACITPNDVWHF